VDGAVSSLGMTAGVILDNQIPVDQIDDDQIDIVTTESALLSVLPDVNGPLTTQVVGDSQAFALTGMSAQLMGLAGDDGDTGQGNTGQAGDVEILDLLSSGFNKSSPQLSGTSAMQPLQEARPNPLMVDLSTGKFFASDVLLPQAGVLTDDSETSGIDLDTGWDMSSGLLTTKTGLLKSAENLLVPLEKSLAADAAKPATPTVTSLVDAFGRPQDNSLVSTRSFMAQIALPQAMGHPQWSQAVGERVLWMAAQNLTAADIRLDPPELGSMQVKVSIQQDQASVSFISPNPQVREALDQQATRLREMFAEQGLNLVHVDVSDRHAQQRESADEQGSGARGARQEEEEGLQILGQSQPINVRLVDHYA
jgi:flagellar hook-length control protein FliK